MTKSHPTTETATNHADAADPDGLVRARIPDDLLERYEFYSYRNAAVILSECYPTEFQEILDALRQFRINTGIISQSGGNESEIPKLLSRQLRPLGWHETSIQGDLLVKLLWRETENNLQGNKSVSVAKERHITRERFLDGHKIDYVKGKVAFDLEWNSKDQTFDRDLYAFRAFAECGVIDVAVLLTRAESLNQVFRDLQIMNKYGASTTWMGKLRYRLNAGRHGGCPVLAIGITPACVEDWPIMNRSNPNVD